MSMIAKLVQDKNVKTTRYIKLTTGKQRMTNAEHDSAAEHG
jgi:hypothetical protein